MLTSYFHTFQNMMGRLDWQDCADILIVAAIFYYMLRLIKGTRALQMMLGVGAIIFMYVLSGWMGLATTHRLLYFILYIIPFAVVVIFQAAIRKVLASMGQNPFKIFTGSSSISTEQTVKEVSLAAKSLASKKTGALIVFEREQGLKTYVDTGIALDAIVSYDLIRTIFVSGTALHDGAVIIQENRAVAASCFLPLTLNPVMSRNFGTRHRAAIGITEETDAIAIVVSEERGVISLVVDGSIRENLGAEKLESLLLENLRIKKRLNRK